MMTMMMMMMVIMSSRIINVIDDNNIAKKLHDFIAFYRNLIRSDKTWRGKKSIIVIIVIL